MRKEFTIPSVEPEKIRPDSRVSKKTRTEQQERQNREDSISHYVRKWWRGDAHVHSSESTEHDYGHFEALYNPDEIQKYEQELGLEFVVLTEHASDPSQPEQLDIEHPISQSLLQEAEMVYGRNKESEGDFALLSGVEASILFDQDGQPTLDLPDASLNKLDLVIASRHTLANSKDPSAIKASLLTAIAHGAVDVIGHPDRNTRHNKETSQTYWQEYWKIWPEILEQMRVQNVVFEINLNAPPSKKLLEMAAKANILFSINFDAHDFNQYKRSLKGNEPVEAAKRHWGRGEFTDEDKRILHEYKVENLGSGPGVHAILGLVRALKCLESYGVTPDRVINSSLDNMLYFLTEVRGKNTENLSLLRSKRKGKV